MSIMSTALSTDQILAFCSPSARDVAMTLVAETGSTNADLLQSVARLRGPQLLIAEAQTAGRGRAGRSWHSEPGAALTFSLAWKFDLPAQALLGLPLAVGVVIAESLAQFGADVRLKWPNDVLRNGKKVAGVLIETANVGDQWWAVIGIGINLAMPEQLAALIGRPVAALPSLSSERNRVMAILLNGLTEAMQTFAAQGFAAFRERWNVLHAYAGQQVVILDGDRVMQQGRAVGVDDSGRLLLQTATNEMVTVLAGDVSLRARES